MADPRLAGLSVETIENVYRNGSKLQGYKAKFDKYKLRYDQVKGLLDEDKRSDVLFDLGVERLQDLLGKILGEVPVMKLFWTFHKQHFAAIKDIIAITDVAKDVATLQTRMIELVKQARRNSDKMVAAYGSDATLATDFATAAEGVVLEFKKARPLLEAASVAMHAGASPTPEGKAAAAAAVREILLLNRHMSDVEAQGQASLDDLLAQWAALGQMRAAVAQAQARITKRLAALAQSKNLLRRGGGQMVAHEAELQRAGAWFDDDGVQDEDLTADITISMSVVGANADQWTKRLDAWKGRLEGFGMAALVSSIFN